MWVCGGFLFCVKVLVVFSGFAFVFKRKRNLVALLRLYSCCRMAVSFCVSLSRGAVYVTVDCDIIRSYTFKKISSRIIKSDI